MTALPPLREVIAAHGLQAKKKLGQHFLLDGNLLERIARAAGPVEGAHVIEIGPGPGGLTRALLAAGAARVTAVELDRRCLAPLNDLAARYPGRLDVIEGDALKLDLAGLAKGPHPKIVANLPYNVGSPLLVQWLTTPDWPPWWRDATVMLQREVVERLAAAPGGRDYGRLSVLAQWRAEVSRALIVPPAAFTPPPRVESAVARLVPWPEPQAPAPLAALQRVVAAAFGQRRKMLRQSLKGLGDARALLQRVGVDETARAETLTVAQFAALARALGE